MEGYRGRTIIVTGATSGIGARIAERFISEGGNVVLAARREREGKAAAERLGPNAVFVRTDVTDEQDVAALTDAALARFDQLDCFVNCAGTPGKMKSIIDESVEQFDSDYAIAVRGPMLGMKYAAKAMLPRKEGCIINIASVSGLRAGNSAHSYSAAKAALIHLTRSVATELGEMGIRVNSISPGLILTGIFAKGGKANGGNDQSAENLRKTIGELLPSFQPLPQIGVPDDVAEVALFLASDAARFVTGQDIPVDGGITAGRPFSVGLANRSKIAHAAE